MNFTLNIHFTADEALVQAAAHLAAALSGQTAAALAPRAAAPEPAAAAPEPAAEAPAPEAPAPEAPAPEAPAAEAPAPEAPAAEAPASEPATGLAESLIKKWDKDYSRGQSTTVQGRRVTEGDELVSPDGEVGVIAACYRGRCILEFENGGAQGFLAGDLTLRATQDEPPAAPQANGQTAPASNGQAAPEPDPMDMSAPGDAVTLDDLRTAMGTLCDTKGRAAGVDVLRSFDAMKMGDVKPEAYPAFLAALTAAATA